MYVKLVKSLVQYMYWTGPDIKIIDEHEKVFKYLD